MALVTITSDLVKVFSLCPLAEMDEQFIWLTDVQRAIYGEKRQQTREFPRYSVRYSFPIFNMLQEAYARNFGKQLNGVLVGVPLWAKVFKIPLPTSGKTTFTFTFPAPEFLVDDYIIFYESWQKFTIRKVTGATTITQFSSLFQQVTIDTALPTNTYTQLFVAPLALGFIEALEVQKTKGQQTAVSFEFQVDFIRQARDFRAYYSGFFRSQTVYYVSNLRPFPQSGPITGEQRPHILPFKVTLELYQQNYGLELYTFDNMTGVREMIPTEFYNRLKAVASIALLTKEDYYNFLDFTYFVKGQFLTYYIGNGSSIGKAMTDLPAYFTSVILEGTDFNYPTTCIVGIHGLDSYNQANVVFADILAITPNLSLNRTIVDLFLHQPFSSPLINVTVEIFWLVRFNSDTISLHKNKYLTTVKIPVIEVLV